MANFYCLLATEFPFPEQAAIDFMSMCNTDLDDYPQWFVNKYKLTEGNLDKFLEDNGIYWGTIITTSYDGEKLYIASGDNGSVTHIAFMLSEVMQHYNIKDPIIIEYVYTCSELRPGAFGGGVAVVGPGTWRVNSTAAIGEKWAKAMRKALSKK